MPRFYRNAVVEPMPKNGYLKDADNYRGISLISVVAKVINYIVSTRLHCIAESDKILVMEQTSLKLERSASCK